MPAESSFVEVAKEVAEKILPPTQYQPATPPKWFFNKLARLVPDWKVINSDPDFIEWLGQADSYSQKSRHEQMSEAYTDNNAESVAFFFIGYKKEARDHN